MSTTDIRKTGLPVNIPVDAEDAERGYLVLIDSLGKRIELRFATVAGSVVSIPKPVFSKVEGE